METCQENNASRYVGIIEEIFDSIVGSFSFFFSSARCRFDAVSIGNIVYFVGGMCDDPHKNSLEMYCPSMSMEPVKLATPKLPRYDHSTALLNGKIYFIGGIKTANNKS